MSKVFGTHEAAFRNRGKGEEVYRVTNPYRSPLYVLAANAQDALRLAVRVWKIGSIRVSPQNPMGKAS